MPNINIQTLNYTDPQSDVIDKLNHNFDEIIEGNGGSQGIDGPTGSDGPIGNRGRVGETGATGIRGTRWYVQTSTPLNSSVAEGDFWVDAASGEINIFTESGWTPTGYLLSSDGNIFLSTPSVYSSGGTGSAIMLDQVLPENYLFIIADKVSESGILNEKLSKFIISTDTSVNDSPLLEFSRSDLENGTIGDYSKHPVFRWKNFNANDNSVILQIPGGAFIMGVSGGFQSTFDTLNLTASQDAIIDYGATSGSGIYSTGGFDINSTSGNFGIISSFINVTGGSGYISAPVNTTASLPNGVSSAYLYSGGTGSFMTSRMSDTFETLSHSVYNVSLESSSGREFFIDTKGKIKTNKYETSIQYASTTPGATSIVNPSQRVINWCLISRPGTPVNSSVLENGNTIILNPTVTPTNSYIGVGIYDGNEYSWGGSGGLDYGQSIDIDVHFSPNTFTAGFSDGFRYIGKGATSGNVTRMVSLPFPAASIEFTVSRGVTAGNTSVFYRAYGPSGGSGGSFII